MDIPGTPFKRLLDDPTEEVLGGKKSDPLLEHEEVVGSKILESEAVPRRSGSFSLPACFRRVKFGKQDRRHTLTLRRVRSVDRESLASEEYQPIIDVLGTDSEEENLVSQQAQQKSNRKVRSIVEACKRFLGLAL